MANATRATIARPNLFFTVLLRVQLPLCTALPYATRPSRQYIPTRRYVLCPIRPACQGLSGDICRFSAHEGGILTTTAHLPPTQALTPRALLCRLQPNPPIYPLMRPHQLALAPSRGRLTRERLLKAAKALFLLKGPATVTVDDICLAADASKGGFYHHFPDKESAFLVVASEELSREMEVSVQPAADTPTERGASTLLVDLWAWAPRRPQACRSVRAVHRRALKQLSKVPGQAAYGTPSTDDREAQAALALLLGIGRLVQRATARYSTATERERGKAAAG
jgi:AcrR family transcriptional regulator